MSNQNKVWIALGLAVVGLYLWHAYGTKTAAAPAAGSAPPAAGAGGAPPVKG